MLPFPIERGATNSGEVIASAIPKRKKEKKLPWSSGAVVYKDWPGLSHLGNEVGAIPSCTEHTYTGMEDCVGVKRSMLLRFCITNGGALILLIVDNR